MTDILELANKRIDDALDSVLRASGSKLANYTMQKSLDDMRKAMRKIMSDSYIQGGNDTFKVYALPKDKDERK